MGDYLQQQRKLRVTTPLGENELLLKAFTGSEGISTLFGYRLEMIAENKTKVPFDAVLGQKVTVHMQLPDESETHLNGLCVRFAQAERDSTFTLYQAELVPDVWKCDDDSAERSVALVVANTLNSSLKALKVSLRSNGSVYATVELFLDGFDAFRNVAPRCLDLLGAATWEFRSRMREARQKADDEEAAGRALAEAGADDDGEQP